MKTKTQLDKNHVLPPLRHLVLLSLSFFTLFVAFTPSQSYAVVIFGNFGVLGVIILYTCFCLTNLVAPYVVKRLGITFALTLGAMGYLPFVLALAVNSEIVFILGSVTCGGGAALLWVSLGCAVTLLSNPSTRGRRFGLFSFCIPHLLFLCVGGWVKKKQKQNESHGVGGNGNANVGRVNGLGRSET